MLATSFSENLVRLREKRGLTQSELARLLGKPRQTVWKWGRAIVKPDPAELIAIADALGCTVDELVRPIKEAS